MEESETGGVFFETVQNDPKWSENDSKLFETIPKQSETVRNNPRAITEMILRFASRYACLGDLDKWAASRLQVACK